MRRKTKSTLMRELQTCKVDAPHPYPLTSWVRAPSDPPLCGSERVHESSHTAGSSTTVSGEERERGRAEEESTAIHTSEQHASSSHHWAEPSREGVGGGILQPTCFCRAVNQARKIILLSTIGDFLLKIVQYIGETNVCKRVSREPPPPTSQLARGPRWRRRRRQKIEIWGVFALFPVKTWDLRNPYTFCATQHRADNCKTCCGGIERDEPNEEINKAMITHGPMINAPCYVFFVLSHTERCSMFCAKC